MFEKASFSFPRFLEASADIASGAQMGPCSNPLHREDRFGSEALGDSQLIRIGFEPQVEVCRNPG